MFTFWLQFHGGDSNTNPYLYDAPLDDLIEDLVIEKGHELSRDEIDFMLEVLVPYTVELVHAYYEDDVSEANAREHINELENSFYCKTCNKGWPPGKRRIYNLFHRGNSVSGGQYQSLEKSTQHQSHQPTTFIKRSYIFRHCN
jgi:hypothetical protein